MGKQDNSEQTRSPTRPDRLVGVSARTVERWARAGRVGCLVTVGGHRRVDRDDVIRVVTAVVTADTTPGSSP